MDFSFPVLADRGTVLTRSGTGASSRAAKACPGYCQALLVQDTCHSIITLASRYTRQEPKRPGNEWYLYFDIFRFRVLNQFFSYHMHRLLCSAILTVLFEMIS